MIELTANDGEVCPTIHNCDAHCNHCTRLYREHEHLGEQDKENNLDTPAPKIPMLKVICYAGAKRSEPTTILYSHTKSWQVNKILASG